MSTNRQRITVKRVSELTGMNVLTIRNGIEQGRLPFGSAIKNGENRTYFYVCPNKLAEYLGISVEEVYGGKN